MTDTPTTPTRQQQHNGAINNNNNNNNKNKLPPPAHLSEFYSFLDNGHVQGQGLANENLRSPISSVGSIRNNTNNNHNNNNANAKARAGNSTVEGSMISSSNSSNFSSYTNDNTMDDIMVITLKDILNAVSKYETMLQKASKYAELLKELSLASNEFGQSIEEVAQLSGMSPPMVEDYYKSGGLQFMNGNYELILSNMIFTKFVTPISEILKNFKRQETEKDSIYKKQIAQRLDQLKLKEQDLKRFNKLKRKKLMLNKYKFNLMSITQELDNIQQFKIKNYEILLQDLNQLHSKILLNLSGIIRSQLEINETIAKKSWSGGGLDELISKCPDPFNVFDPSEEEEEEEEEEDVTLNNIDDITRTPTPPQQDAPEEEEDDLMNVSRISPMRSAKDSSDHNSDDIDDDDDGHNSIKDTSFSLPMIQSSSP